jgi:hypothetical protein
MRFVPVVDKDGNPLMPTKPSRARRWIKSGKATPFWSRGVFCVRLNVEPSARYKQPIAVGIDSGSKMEGYSVKSETHTYLNVQAHAVTHVKKAVETRRNMRRARRYRKTRRRPAKFNNRKNKDLPPSTKARWQWRLRIAKWLTRLFPVTVFVVENIKATTRPGKKRWNQSFTPLEVGKTWFYSELARFGQVYTKEGWETKQLRKSHGLKKTSRKLDESFDAHCVDAWCLANWYTGGHVQPDNTELLVVVPLRFNRRQLHMLQFAKGGVRRRQGGTRSLGFKRGSYVKHLKYGLCYVGGHINNRISLHDINTGKRLTQQAKPDDCKFVCFASWRYKYVT